MAAWRREVGQASVETVALLPLVVLVGALLWQAVVAGQALWLSGAAARAAARAAAVAFIPGGGSTAALVAAILSTLIMVSLVFFAYRFYREHRVELDGLGDRWRGLLYGAIGAVVLALAALPRLSDSSGGTLVVVALLGGAAYAFYAVWRHYREYA